MLVILSPDCSVAEVAAVEASITAMGYTPLAVPGENRTAICVTGNKGPVDAGPLRGLPGVVDCIRVTKPYKLVSREVHPADTVITVGRTQIGGDATPVMIAGPCSVETEARTLRIAEAVKAAGATMFRAGAFKPRTSPYDFQGLGVEALHTLRQVREQFELPIVSEIVDASHLEQMIDTVDVLQVGARNMQNFALLQRLADQPRPVLLKRGAAATLTEWLMAAEYLLAGGKRDVILCERGIRSFSDHSRNTLDLNVVPVVRQMSHLPILVDPSHGTGRRERVRAMARAGIAAGAQGLLVEAHFDPASSYTDAAQTVSDEVLKGISADLGVLAGLGSIE
ncbi:MAG: 3-deoxy-7-phosphoheptulonate synthase [bacterium]|nr:3-deoxy-7-phosphoheptulonate synthase [bacterium]